MRRLAAATTLAITLAAAWCPRGVETSASPAAGSEQQPRCAAVPKDGMIRSSGRYCVEGERVVPSGIGIDVAARNVVLDLGKARVRLLTNDARSVGIQVREGATGTMVLGGVIEGFAIGIAHTAGSGLRVQGVTFRRIGAIAILASGNGSRINGNIIESVGGQPLDPANAYAIAANLTGRDVVFQHNTIRDVRRQALAAEVVGEAVGVLIGDECLDCLISNNQVTKLEPETDSIGMWNSGKGKVEIRHNQVSGFSQGVVSLGRQFIVHGNEIRCGGGAGTTAHVISLVRSGAAPGAADGEASAMANRTQACAIDQMICDNGCKAPWALETAQRLWRQPKGDR
jgi:hypothetical protein